MNGFYIAPSSRDIIDILQTNQCSPNLELIPTSNRQMAMSSYQRPRKFRRNTTISIFTQCVEGETPQNKSFKKKNYFLQLKKFMSLVKISLSFINSLKEFQYKQKVDRIDTYQWKRQSIFPFFPDDYLIAKWKSFIEFLTFICVIIYPIYVFFDIKITVEKIIMVFDLIFLVDIALNFLTAFVDESNTLIQDYYFIAENYIKTWFFWDIISAIPTTKDEEEWLKFFKIFRVVKYFLNKKEVTYKGQQNYVRLRETLNPQTTYSLTTGTKYLLNVLVTSCLLIHIFGCWRHFVEQDDYITNIYWSTQTITTVGYGDLETEYKLSIIWMIIGVAFYSFTIGDFALMMQKSKFNQEQEILFLVEQLSHSQNLSEKLKFKFSHFIKSNIDKNPFWLDEYKTMTKQLPYSLRMYLITSAQLEICKQIPFFLYDLTYTHLLLLNLKYLTVEEGFVLYREGQNSSEVYFLLDGYVRIMTKDKSVLLNIMEGTIFGEFEAIEEKLRGTYCVAQRQTQILVIPYRILRRVMELSPILDFEIRQLHLRRRRLLINNFLIERRKRTEYRRQTVKQYTQSFIQMTKEEYILEKQKKQLFNVEEYNKQMLNKLIGKKLLKLQQFLIKFKRSVQRVIEMNHLLDETIPELWKELNNYQLIKRIFPTEYLKQKYSMISISRKSSSVHSSVSKFSKMKYSTYSQQYFFAKLPEVRIKHIALQHFRLMKNKFIPLQQIANKYYDDPEQLQNNIKSHVERSIWNKKYTKISQTVILRIDQIQDSGDKYYDIMKKIKRIEQIWLQGSILKFELFQLMRGNERQQFLD